VTEEHNNNPSETITLKRFGVFLKEKGIKVQPLAEAANAVETILVDKKDLLNTAKLLKEDKNSLFDLLISVSGVDRIKEELLESVYHLYSTTYHHMLVLKVRVSRDKPEVPSVSSLWITADWHEREAYDLMGIIYTGHPNLKRILLPDDWRGYPLRKDYKLEDERLVWNER
jgi:NADH-quinone oxidoreductase subunit C